MKESTKYDQAISDKTSVYSTNVGLNKGQYEESIDLICLELTNLGFKIDFCPENNESEEPQLLEIFKHNSIPEVNGHMNIELYGYNIDEKSKLKLIYPVELTLNMLSQFEKGPRDYVLLKFLNIK